jgi:hypothetical protein
MAINVPIIAQNTVTVTIKYKVIHAVESNAVTIRAG